MPMIPLGQIAEVKLGKMLDKSKHTTGRKFSYLRNINVRWGRIDTSDLSEMFFKESEAERFSVNPGDVLVCEGGEPGRAAVWRGDHSNLKYQKALHRVRFLHDYEPRLLVYYLELLASRGALESRFTGSTIKHFTREAFVQLPVPNPPLPEQRRIVARIEELFSRLDAGVAALRHAKAQLQRYRQSVLAAAVTGQLTQAWREQHPGTEPAAEQLKAILKKRREMWEGRRKYAEPPIPDTDDLPILPSSWTWATVAQQSDPDERSISDGPFGSKLKSSHYTASGPRVFRLQNIGDGFFKDEYAHISEEHFKTLSNHEIFSGDLLIKALGIPAHQTCMVPPGVGPAIVKADCIRFKVFEPYINPMFALLALNSHPVRARSEKMIHGVGRPRLNGSEIKRIALPFPPIAEQHQIVAEVEARTTAIAHLEAELDRQLARTIRMRQSILSKAFEGELLDSQAEDKKAVISPPKSRPNRHFARALLSGEIVHQLHAEPTFGRIKHQKIFHLCEHIAEISEIGGNYRREAAGPLDNKLIYSNEAELKKQKWYREVKRKPYGHSYEPMEKAGQHRKYLEQYWPDKLGVVDGLIALMRGWTTDRCEIFCTAYTAWNDLIIQGHEPSDAAILTEILERWHVSKNRFGEKRWLSAINWMRDNGYAPTGFGKPSERQDSK